MTVILALIAGIAIGYLGTRTIARIGFRRDDVIANVLDGLTLTQLNRLRDHVTREIQTRLRQADDERWSHLP